MVDQVDLARTVPAKHGADLGNGDVAFVHHQQEVLGEVVKQTKRPFPRLPAVEVPGVVLDARAEAEFFDHFQVVQRALVEPLGFQKPRLLVEKRLLLFKVLLDFPNRRIGGLLAADEQVGRVDGELVEFVQDRATFGVNRGDSVDFVVPKFNPHGVVCVGEVDVHHVSLHPELSATKVGGGSAVQASDEAVQEVIPRHALPPFQGNDVFVEFHGVANAVDAADARHHDDVASPTQQRRRGGKPELFDFVVDLQVLFDVGV